MRTHTKETQATITPQKALDFLKEGNLRFQNNVKAYRNLQQQVKETSEGQFPFAVILSCIDSRVSAELVFDQGLGDIFSIRIAGNFVNKDILGSLEFACMVAGAKAIVVLGHSGCGAIKGACDNVVLGNLTGMLKNLKPAVDQVTDITSNRTSSNAKFVQRVSEMNVKLTIAKIISESDILRKMYEDKQIIIVGGNYDVRTGRVSFMKT